jgi:hypothetical protein
LSGAYHTVTAMDVETAILSGEQRVSVMERVVWALVVLTILGLVWLGVEVLTDL